MVVRRAVGMAGPKVAQMAARKGLQSVETRAARKAENWATH
jgi:hypothetical protein